MYTKKILLLGLILTLSLSIGFGLISQDDIILQVSENGVVSAVHEIVAEDETNIEIKIPTVVRGTLRVYDALEENLLDYNYNESDDQLVFDIPESYLISKEITAFRVEYDTLIYTSKILGTWTLNFDIDVDPNETTIQVMFPPNTKVLKTNIPVNTFIRGNLLVLEANPKTKRFIFDANYEINPIGTDTTDNQDIFMILTMFIFVIFVVMIVIYLWSTQQKRSQRKRRKKKAPPRVKKARRVKQSVAKVLDNNERKVVDFLESRVDASHAQIHRGTNLAKTTLSKVIKRLEMRNIIEKQPFGRRSRIKLQKWVFE
jgi:uncharacterized membrane protein